MEFDATHPLFQAGEGLEAIPGALAPVVASWGVCRMAGRTTSTSAMAVNDTCVVMDLHGNFEPLPAGTSTHVWGRRRLMRIVAIYEVKRDARVDWVVQLHPFVYAGPDQDSLIPGTVPGCTVWQLDTSESAWIDLAHVIRPLQCVHLCTLADPPCQRPQVTDRMFPNCSYHVGLVCTTIAHLSRVYCLLPVDPRRTVVPGSSGCSLRFC